MIKTKEFSLFKGKLTLRQPEDGYRVAIDPLLLAATVPKDRFENKKILDLGCGIGTIGFCILKRLQADITAIDIQTELIEIAEENNKLTGFNINFICSNILNYQVSEDDLFDMVVMNPPYMAEGTKSKSQMKRVANSESLGIKFKNWVEIAGSNLKKGGYLFLIHRADRLDEILAVMRKLEFGSFRILPIYPKIADTAKRVIIVARKQKYAPSQLLFGLTLHKNNAYTDEAKAILEDMKEIKILK